MTRVKYIVFSIVAILTMGILLSISNVSYVSAGQFTQWMADQRIPGYPDYIFTPYIITDQNRTVHAFSSQWVGDVSRQVAVVYRQWSLARGWTKPVDILVSPVGEAQVQSAFLDSSGIIHVIFWGGTPKEAYIFYSRAFVANADLISAWSYPVVIGEMATQPPSAVIDGDESGNLVVIYGGNVDGLGIYEIHSTDSGNTWSKSRSIFQPSDINLVPYSLRLDMGKTGNLHAAWNVVTSDGIDLALYYAQYNVAADQWSEPFMLDKRSDIKNSFGPSFPALIDNGQQVVILYNNGSPMTNRQIQPGSPVEMVAMSKDDGKSWQQPIVPFYRHLGRSGEHTIAMDSNGTINTLFIQRIEYQSENQYQMIAGIWHSELIGETWSDPDRLVTTYAPHDVRAVISQGNVLLALWREDPGDGQHGIWYSYKILDSPELPIVIPPTPVMNNVITSESGSFSDPEVAATPTLVPPDINLGDSTSGIVTNPAGPILIALGVVLLVLVGVVIIYQIYRARNS